MAQSTFAYKARDQQGNMVTGKLVGTNAGEIASRLRAEGKIVINVSDNSLRAAIEFDPTTLRRSEAAKRVRRTDVIAFCQQMSVMLETGVPLSEALEAFCRQTPRKEFRTILNEIRDQIFAGESISTSLARYPRVFPTMMVSLMKASEASGTMSSMFGSIGDYLAKERRTARQIKGALSYPLFMMFTAVGLTIFLMTFILPRFAKIYEMRSATLPAPTRVLLAVSNFVTHQYMYYGPVLVVFAITGFIFLRSQLGRRLLDWIRLNFPVLRIMYRQLYITRAARTLSTLLEAGVNLLDIIEICRGVTNNYYYTRLWARMAQGVRDGNQISDAVMNVSFIPPNVASMISSGERSGRLPHVMDRIAVFSEEELDTAVKQVTSFIEPVMILFMGVVVGGVAMALLLPIFSMGRVVSGGG
ncbi:MAG TPA: type II secretion system F family protein [Phycisphaerales bacterium]|nr:type II secretion system F family protein [Phycisphaerales bacterium]